MCSQTGLDLLQRGGTNVVLHFKGVYWVPEGSLADFVLGRLLGSGRPLGALKPSQNVGGRSPLHFWMVLKLPGAAQTPKTDPQNSGQTAFRYPEGCMTQHYVDTSTLSYAKPALHWLVGCSAFFTLRSALGHTFSDTT